ncbi:MAG: hypothetical protein ACE5HQ_05215 [Gemmatimonadota bacterium]
MSGAWRKALVAGLTLILAGAPSARAQEAGSALPDSTAGYEREMFTYPGQGRRDPFRPLTAGERIGPRFEDLQLNGVLYSPAVGSVATLTDQKTGKRYRAREGDSLGEIRVVEIRRDSVVFLITSFGINRREVLRVKKDKEQVG